jgi:hypothetical protein
VSQTSVLVRRDRRPAGHRPVPLLAEHDLGHYPEFRAFLARTFDLDRNPFGPPGLVSVGERVYQLVFFGRSESPFPAGVAIDALLPGLEPMDERAVDRDLWMILQWLVDGAGYPWSADELTVAGRIYRIPEAMTSESTPTERGATDFLG